MTVTQTAAAVAEAKSALSPRIVPVGWRLIRVFWTVAFMLVVVLMVPSAAGASQWRSAFYPEDWTPAYSGPEGRFLHDFSYAGYGAGERPIPSAPPGLIYDVTGDRYGADPTGAIDATATIQRAIDDAQAAGGGIVYLPPGTYRISPRADQPYALRISRSRTVLRGAGPQATRLFLSTPLVRDKATIKVSSFDAESWFQPSGGSSQRLRSDVSARVTVLPLDGPPAFNEGDWVIVTHDLTVEWLHEHRMDCAGFPSACWQPSDQGPSAAGVVPAVTVYRRITAVDQLANTITVDAPLRYYLRTRDSARVYRPRAHIEEVGIEGLSIGEQEHPGECVSTDEGNNPAFPCNYETHNHDTILFRNVVHGWVRDVASYAPPSNPRGYHLLSDGIVLFFTRHITVQDTDLQKPQNRGGGGNGSLYIHSGNDSLIQRAKAYEGRHNFSFKFALANGNVIRDSLAFKGSLNSDFHMQLSLANLIENVTLDQEIFEAVWRSNFGAPGLPHAQTGTQNVFWNTNSVAARGASPYSVLSDQFDWGLVIGTRGVATAVSVPVTLGRTEPPDIVEGQGLGATLSPPSLYLDQLARRLGIGAAVTLNQPVFAVGQTLSPTVGATNPGRTGSADFYVGLYRPDGTIQFFTGSGFSLGSLADFGSFRPIALGVPLTTPFAVRFPNLFSYQLTASDPKGDNVVFLLVLKAGALVDGVVTADEILALAMDSFSLP